MVFWITCHTRAKKGQGINELMVIKLFSGNYARDLLCYITKYGKIIKIRDTALIAVMHP